MSDVDTESPSIGTDQQTAPSTTAPARPGAAADPSAAAGATRWGNWPIAAMVVVGVVLGSFAWFSRDYQVGFGIFPHPPLYGRWGPVVDPLALLVVLAGVLLVGVSWFVVASRRVPTWLLLMLIVIAGVVAAAAVNLARGYLTDLYREFSTDPGSPDYPRDLHYVWELGIRGVGEHHAELTQVFEKWNLKTHPPGVLVFQYLLYKILGGTHGVWIATAIALLGMLSAVAAWSIGRTIGGERAGRIAAVLFVAAPGPLLLAYTVMDAVFATFLSAGAALYVLALQRLSWRWAAAAGAMVGVTVYLTYAAVFVALAAAVATLIQVPGIRTRLRMLGAAAAGGVVVLAAERLLLNYDLLSAYRSVPPSNHVYDPYWIVASPAAFLIFAGIPLAGLGMAGLFRRFPGARRHVLPLVLVLMMFVWAALPTNITHLRPGEVERTWAFLFPLLAAAAGAVVANWTRDSGRRGNLILGGLIAVSLAQATALQLTYNVW